MKIQGTTINTPLARTAVVKDDIVSGKPWSSKNTIDKLCPSFTESGAVVTCEPVEGYPLEVAWQTKNLLTTDTVELTSNAMNKTIWTGSLSAPFVLSADLSQLTETGTSVGAGLLELIIDGSSVYAGGSVLSGDKGYVVKSGTLTKVIVINWTAHKGTAKFQLEVGTQKTAFEPYAETANITRCGKNLFDYKKWVAFAKASNNNSSNAKENVTHWGRECFSYPLYRTDTSIFFTDIKFKPNTQYTFKMQGAINSKYSSTWISAIAIIYEDGTQSSYVSGICYDNRFVEMEITSQAGKTIKHLAVQRNTAEAVLYVPIDSCVIMEGTTAEYVPYTGETFAQGEQIPAVQGINNLWADSGIITVSGRADLSAKVKRLENVILAMGANV